MPARLAVSAFLQAIVEHDDLESPENDPNTELKVEDTQSNFSDSDAAAEPLTNDSSDEEDEWESDSEEEEVERDTNEDTIYVITIDGVHDEYYNDHTDAFEHAKYLGNVLASQFYNGKLEFDEDHTEVRVVSVSEGWVWDASYVHKVIKITEVVPQ